MKKLVLCCLLALSAIYRMQAQNVNVFPTPTGNVGVGTSSPQYPLDVVTTSSIPAHFSAYTTNNSWISVINQTGSLNLGIGAALPHPYVYSSTGNLFIGGDGANPTLYINGMVNGKVGIGTITPTAQLEVATTNNMSASFNSNTTLNSFISVSNTNARVNLGIGSANPNPYIYSYSGNLFIGADGFTPTLYVNGMVNGNIGIGTMNTGSNKLAVEGTIGARKMVVTQTNPFPDYVFKPGYQLSPLDSISLYIHVHQHLPEMASADSVAANGLDLGGNQVLLLKKIEELTLYAIEQNKQYREQGRQLAAMRKELNKLKKQAAVSGSAEMPSR